MARTALAAMRYPEQKPNRRVIEASKIVLIQPVQRRFGQSFSTDLPR
jgi:hypothetical protein